MVYKPARLLKNAGTLTPLNISVASLLRHPEALVPSHLEAPPRIRRQLAYPVAGWIALRSIAVMVRSVLMNVLVPGIIVSIGSVVLQLGVWGGLVWMLPAVVRPFSIVVTHRQAAVLATLLCAPVWMAGVLFIIPEEPLILFMLSRLGVLACGAYGVRLFARALTVMPAAHSARMPAITSVAGAYVMLYALLFTAVGITTNIIIYFAEN